jgi:hypothetical protein
MSAVQEIADRPTNVAGPGPSRRWLRAGSDSATAWALLRKELAESRAAAIAGVTIFVGLPAFLMTVYTKVDPGHETLFGFATGLLYVGGWLFAAVVAAQSIGRDFGRAQGTFLLARPVTPCQVLRAKVLVGFGLVMGVLLAVGVVELIASQYSRTDSEGLPAIWFTAVSLTVLAYWVALAAACITRQTLSSVMLAGLALALALALPMLTTAPADGLQRADRWLYGSLYGNGDDLGGDQPLRAVLRDPLTIGACTALAAAVVYGVRRAMLAMHRRPEPSLRTLWPTLVLIPVILAALVDAQQAWVLLVGVGVLVVVGALWLVAQWAVRNEHGLKMGVRSLAWTLGGALVLVFSLAMHEVGANVPVCDTYWLPGVSPTEPYATCFRFGCGRRRIALGRGDGSVLRFDIGPDGRVHALSEGTAASTGAAIDGNTEPIPLFDESDELYSVSAIYGSAEQSRASTPGDTLIALSHIDWHTGNAEIIGRAMPPPSTPVGATVSDAHLEGGRLAIILGVLFETERIVRYERTLAVYRLEGNGLATLEGHRRLEPCDFQSAPGQPALVYNRSLFQYAFVRSASGQVYPQLADGEISGTDDPNAQPLRRATERWLDECGPSQSLPITESLMAVSERAGFDVFEATALLPRTDATSRPTLRWREIGRAPASPWAMLFRTDYATLVSPGRNIVWETQGPSAVCYDVADPHNPRKIAHVMTQPIRAAIAGPEYLVLNHGYGFSLVRHPR